MKRTPLLLILLASTSVAAQSATDQDHPPLPPQTTAPAPAAAAPTPAPTAAPTAAPAAAPTAASAPAPAPAPTTRPNPAGNPADMADKFFGTGAGVSLSAQEAEALAISGRWQSGQTTAMRPITGKNGAVKFVFGSPVSIVCAVLQVCDVALQAGEQINSINLGDTARWIIEPAITGRGPSEVQHLIIKPLDVGLETSMVVTTNRRTYHMRLKSHRSKYMPTVEFEYPEDAAAKLAAIARREIQEIANNTMPTGEYLGDLHFNYDISGSARWKPVRVYNDGRKTIIEMPEAMNQTEAPTLLVVRSPGGLFSDEETVIVNYRVQNNRYIVDTVFDQAVLIAGVGSTQDRITITRKE